MTKRGDSVPNTFGSAVRKEWLLQPGISFLNHGSFGATPRLVLAAQAKWRRRMERQPVQFMTRILPGALRDAAAALAAFLGTSADRLVFVDNATTAVNTVLRSIPWRAGDELVLSDHAYPAVKNAVRYIGGQAGVTVREAGVPFPLRGAEQVVDAFMEQLTKRTRLVLVDHVASPSALVFPVEEIVNRCKQAGIAVLVDGAHAPGMLPLELDGLGADWYVGNCHKWLFAPKGCAFLWTTPSAQRDLHPLVISNHFGKGYLAEFDWTGTRDPSPWLSITAALEFYRWLGGESLRGHNHGLAISAARVLAQAWGVPLPAPEDMFDAMVTMPVPSCRNANQRAADELHDALWEKFRVEVPVIHFKDRLWVRISAQAYNEISDYEVLAEGILSLQGL